MLGFKLHSGITEQTPSIFKWALFLFFLLLLISRNTIFFTDPRFWAEEATLYFNHAYTHSLSEHLSFMAAGYYNFINVVSTALAHRLVPLESAPIVTTLIAMSIQLLPAFIILFGNIRIFSDIRLKILALMILLFMIPNREVWLNVINSQFYLAIATALILLHSSRTQVEKFSYYVILLISGFSGVISLFLFPLFVFRAISRNDREKWVQSGILLVAGLIQAYLILTSDNGLRQGDFDIAAFVFIFMIKVIGLPLLGPEITVSLAAFFRQMLQGSWFFLFLALSVIGVLGWLMFNYIKHYLTLEARFLFASSLLLFFFSVYGALGEKAQLVNALENERYFIAPNTLFYLSMIAMLGPEPFKVDKTKWVIQFVVVLVLVTGVVNYWSHKNHVSMSGPSWKQQVLHDKDGLRKIMIWPKGWFVNLNTNDYQILERCQENRFMENDLLCLIYSDEKVKIKILFIQQKPQSVQYDLLTYKILENRNPTSFPEEIIYRNVIHLQSHTTQQVKLKILQDGVFFSAMVIESKKS